MHPTTGTGPETAAISTTVSGARAAVAGAVSALVALAAGELTAAVAGSDVSLVTAVGSAFIDQFAASLKDVAVAVFGTNDKVALVVGIVAVSCGLAALLGLCSRRWRAAAPIGIVAAGIAGAWTLASDPQGDATIAVVSGAIAIGAGLCSFGALWVIAGEERGAERLADTEIAGPGGLPGRRRFLLTAGALVAAGGGMTLLARRVRAGDSVEQARRSTVLPRPERSAPLPTTGSIDAPGLTPYITPNADFYRIDTALVTPQVAAEGWHLSLTGLVDRPFELTYDELLRMDSIATPVTLSCVSNEVGGHLISNAVWQGVPLAALLDRAGARADAEQVVGRSVDGFTAGFPLADALDGRTSLVAYAMNGEPLPAAHGYPARLVVAGLYGYVSATKWLREIELTTWDAFDGYWIPRGWSKEGPIRPSRVSTSHPAMCTSAG